VWCPRKNAVAPSETAAAGQRVEFGLIIVIIVVVIVVAIQGLAIVRFFIALPLGTGITGVDAFPGTLTAGLGSVAE